ncbi:MAG TPA: class I SAM-dependent methyltransferase [Gammaproteobacteria bacterium]
MHATDGTPFPLTAHPSRLRDAEALAKRFNLSLAEKKSETPYRLYLGPEYLELQDLNPGAPGPVFVDFTGGKAAHRRATTGKQQPLPRAVGIKTGHPPYVIDATAGLGRDAFVLAALGCRITLVERSTVFAALLEDGLARARLNVRIAPIIDHMQLVHADSKIYFQQPAEADRPDVVYLDPMYPHRSKSALVKKEMRYARAIVGDDEEAPALLATALKTAKERVVVKRPRSAKPLAGPKPTVAIESKNTRYDIYVTKLFI